jgi:dTDP-4-amino-4,6-dideoxygalactose transaminase
MKTKYNIPFVNLSLQFKNLETELNKVFLEVGRNGNYILGEPVEHFEKDIANYCGVKHAISVGNGSDALFLCLKAYGIGPGDEVITAANSFIASAWVIVATGAKPILVDVCDDHNIDPKAVIKALSSKTKAIIPVHLAGRSAQMDELKTIANENGILIIEDAAQAIGATYKNQKIGSIGNAAGFSLHPLKNLGVYGDGGFITTNDDYLAENVRLLRNHGLENRNSCLVWGYNSRLDTLQAAFASVKLKYLDKWNIRNREIAELYRNKLNKYVTVPVDKSWEYNVYHNFVITTSKRDNLKLHLQNAGIGSAIHYPTPIHLQPASISLGYSKGSFPMVERLSSQMLSLPIYPELTNNEVELIIDTIEKFFNN